MDGPDRRCRPVAGSASATTGSLCVELAYDPFAATIAVTRDAGETFQRPAVELPGDLILEPVASLDPDTLGIIGGGDGATLFPFQHVTLSHDGGTTWQQHDLPLFDGATAYSDSQIVLPDGRLLAALSHFSDDGPRRRGPADRVHGLWISTNDDWTTFRPFRATGLPAPKPGEQPRAIELGVTTGRHPLVWAVVDSTTLHVSSDGGVSFDEIDLRAVAAGTEEVPVSRSARDILQDANAPLPHVAEVTSVGSGYRVVTVWRGKSGRPTVVMTARPGLEPRLRTLGKADPVPGAHPLDRIGVGGARTCAAQQRRRDLCVLYGDERARLAFTSDGGATFDRHHLPGERGYLHTAAVSLSDGSLGVVTGADSATLFPFGWISQSLDGGRTWRSYGAPRFDGTTAFSSGQVVLPDGQLLMLLDAFGDDSFRSGLSDRVHGLWVSAGGDWTRFEPFTAEGLPIPDPGWESTIVQLGGTPGPEPLVWALDADRRLHVSRDGGLSFTVVPVGP